MKIFWKLPKLKSDECVKVVAEALLLIDGLSNVEVLFEKKQVVFEAENSRDIDQARNALIKSGFSPEKGDE